MNISKWYVAERYSGDMVCIRAAGSRKLVAEAHVEGSDEKIAKLIASAPDLLAERDALRSLLRKIVIGYRSLHNIGEHIDSAEKLLEGAA